MNLFVESSINLFARAIPAHLLAYYPFRDRLQFSLWKILLMVATLQTAQSLLYGHMVSSGVSGRAAEFGFAVIYMALYFFCVCDSRPKLLFLYLFIMDYVMILRGLSAFVETRFFYTPDMSLSSSRSTLIYLVVLALSLPFMLRFFARAREHVFSVDAPAFWRTAWMVPAFTTAIVIIFTGRFLPEDTRTFQFLFARVLLLLCVFVFYSILLESLEGIRKQAALKEQAAMQGNLMNLQKMQQRQLLKHMEETKAARHDLRQHLGVIRAYLERDDIAGLKDYLDTYEAKLPAGARRTFSGNFALNAVCAYYAEEAWNSKIDFDVSLDFPEHLPVSEPEACALLGNLLENAVEACRDMQHPTPYIRARGICGENYIVITVDNSCRQGPVWENGRILSTKHEGLGIGTWSVQKTAERSGGTASFTCEGGVFMASVLLYG